MKIVDYARNCRRDGSIHWLVTQFLQKIYEENNLKCGPWECGTSHHDNTPAIQLSITEFLAKHSIPVLPQPPLFA
jgi:hypothetical protein